MSNTDNMRVLAILSTQLTYERLIAQDGQGASDQPLQDPSVAVDVLADDRKMP
jgi:hypothetical protein